MKSEYSANAQMMLRSSGADDWRALLAEREARRDLRNAVRSRAVHLASSPLASFTAVMVGALARLLGA